ncbi:MAG: hypothetical protein F4X02_05880 [Chloroflexi bacterium]|nr:hypothetical protein [Chloroflexota bacterium]
MADSTNVVLQRAYELIEDDELEQAQSLLAPLLETDDKNPALWWVYSHAVRDKSIGQLALDRVLELDPSYPGANELKDDLLELQSRDPEFVEPDVDDGLLAQEAGGSPLDEWDDVQAEIEDAGAPSGGRPAVVILAVVLFIIAAGIALVASGAVDISEILSGILPSPEAEIIVVSGPTSAPTEAESDASDSTPRASPETTASAEDEPSAAPTQAPNGEATAAQDEAAATLAPTAEATADPERSPKPVDASNPLAAFVAAVAESIRDFEVDRRASSLHDTPLGRTLVIQTCAVPGREFNARLSQIIHAMVDLTDDIPEGTDAVAAGLLNCAENSASLRVIGVSVEIIQQYLEEEIDSKEFQRAWQPLS